MFLLFVPTLAETLEHPPAELDEVFLVEGLECLLPHLVVGLVILGFENVTDD